MGIRVLPFGKTDCHDQFANRSRNDKFFSLFYCQAAGEVLLRLHQDGAIGGVDHHAGPGTSRLFHIFHRRIIHGYFTAAPALGEVGRQLRRLENALLIRLCPPGTEDHMAAVYFLRVQPEVGFFRRFSGKLVILPVAATHQDQQTAVRAEATGL